MHIFLIQNYAAPATKKPFMNEGKCIVTGDNFKCICTDGFTGYTCKSSLALVRKYYQIHHLTGPDHTTHTTQMHRSVHTTPNKFEKANIIGYFKFPFDENSGRQFASFSVTSSFF